MISINTSGTRMLVGNRNKRHEESFVLFPHHFHTSYELHLTRGGKRKK